MAYVNSDGRVTVVLGRKKVPLCDEQACIDRFKDQYHGPIRLCNYSANKLGW
jgi:hypothetical protein